MRYLKLICTIAALTTAGCEVRKVGDPPDSGGPLFANLCVARGDWPRLLSTLKRFGTEHRLEMHGGIANDTPHSRMLNAYLAQGYSYWFGDDFDLWFVSGVSDKEPVSFSGVLKRQPITREQQALAAELLSRLSKFTRSASGPANNATCG